MGESLSIKNLVGRCARDPWKAVLGGRPGTYQIPEVGVQLIHEVDKALFERKIHAAIRSCIVLEKWSERDPHCHCKAPAVMASIYSVCGVVPEAERQIVIAQKRINQECVDCKAHYFKRLGTFHFHQWNYTKARQAYDRSANLFLSINSPKEAAVGVMNRGVTKYLLHQYDAALRDQEYAMKLMGGEFSMYTIMASINIASIYVALEKVASAIEEISSVQEMFVGENDLERPKLILRWVRAQLLEFDGDLKDAGEILDRIETRMKKLDMKPEIRVLLADRARVARQPRTIQRVARKALDMEEIPRIRGLIERVIQNPTHDTVLKWRSGLQAYVPPFPATM